jgi:hypothetical protein
MPAATRCPTIRRVLLRIAASDHAGRFSAPLRGSRPKMHGMATRGYTCWCFSHASSPAGESEPICVMTQSWVLASRGSSLVSNRNYRAAGLCRVLGQSFHLITSDA